MADPQDDGVVEDGNRPRYIDSLVDARLAGHGWDDVDNFIEQGTQAAQAEGYSPVEIDDFLGRAQPDQYQMRTDAQTRLAHDTELVSKLKIATPDIPLTPLEGPSGERVAGYAKTDPPTVEMPPADFTGPPASGIDLHDEYARNAYARSLLDGSARSPRDFAERYTGSLSAAAGATDAGVAMRAAGELASQLPSDRDFTDQAIAIAHSSGVALAADDVKTVRNNLIDHWTETGQPLQDIYRQANIDPELADKLTTEKKPEPSWFEKIASLPAPALDMEVQQSTDVGQGVTDLAKGWYGWRMGQPDAQPKDWPATRDELVSKLREKPLDDEAMNTALGFVGGSIGAVGAKFGEAIGLFPGAAEKLASVIEKMPEPKVEIINPDAPRGTAPEQIPISKALEPPKPARPQVSLGEPEPLDVAPGEEVRSVSSRYPLVRGDEKIGSADISFTDDGKVAIVDSIAVNGGYEETAAGAAGANQLGPREMRGVARQFFLDHPDVETLTGERITGARAASETEDTYATITRRQALRGLPEFAPDATPSGKIEALAKEWDVNKEGISDELRARNDGELPQESDPNFFEKLATGQDPATVDLAKGWDGAKGLRDYVSTTFRDLMADESGKLTLWDTTEDAAVKARNQESLASFKSSIIRNEGEAKQLIRNTEYQLDPSKISFKNASGDLSLRAVADNLDNSFARINQHVPEFKAELAKGINGDPMSTMVGKFLDYVQGRSMGYALPHDSNLAPVADTVRNIMQGFEGLLRNAHARGLHDMTSYYIDAFPQLWKDPAKARTFSENFMSAGKQGSGGHLQAKTYPTYGDGIRAGLEPLHDNPLYNVLQYAHTTSRYLKSLEILDDQIKGGFAYRATHPNPGSGDVALEGNGTTRALATGVTQRTYASPAGARLWNQWVDRDIPGGDVGGNVFNKMRLIKNTVTQLNLINPSFHAAGIAVEANAGGFGQAISELARGEVGAAAKDIASSATFAPKVAQLWQSGHMAIEHYNTMHPDPVVQNFVRVGEVMDKGRPDYMSPTNAPSYFDSLVRGELGQNWAARLQHIIEADPHGDVSLARAAWRSAEFAGTELSRATKQLTSPLFDHLIPTLKAGVNYERGSMWLRTHPNASQAEIDSAFMQIAKNTEDRLGEMNYDRLFWPKWVKQTAQLSMISPTWVYGFYRFMGNVASSGLNVATLGKLGTFNETAVTNMVGYVVNVAGAHMIYQGLMGGPAPWNSPTPLHDIAVPRAGGTNPKTREPARTVVPGQEKEFSDLMRVGLVTYDNPWNFGEALAHLALSRLAAPGTLGRAFFGGDDAIGHHITEGGKFPSFAARLMMPYMVGAMEDRLKGTGIPAWQTKLGFREAPLQIESPTRFLGQQQKLGNMRLKEDYGRQVRENRYLETPKPLPPRSRGTPSLSPATSKSIEEYMKTRR